MEATLAMMDEQKKRGKLLEAYEAPDACIVTSESPSAEDLIQSQAAVPMAGFLDFKVYPLADFRKSMQAFIEACKQAEKMFPSPPK